jgi:hypothetical protein
VQIGKVQNKKVEKDGEHSAKNKKSSAIDFTWKTKDKEKRQ